MCIVQNMYDELLWLWQWSIHIDDKLSHRYITAKEESKPQHQRRRRKVAKETWLGSSDPLFYQQILSFDYIKIVRYHDRYNPLTAFTITYQNSPSLSCKINDETSQKVIWPSICKGVISMITAVLTTETFLLFQTIMHFRKQLLTNTMF